MDQVSLIREKADVVSLISEYIPLKKAGRNFTAPCPFHNEKSPSFVVSPERQIWHCFGCTKGGDVFTFLMEYEHMDFPEALRILAKKTGIELVESSYNKGVSSQKEKLYKLNKIANEFYNYVLTKHTAGKKPLEYLTDERKINSGVIHTFQIGYSPKSGDGLSRYLLSKKNYEKQDIVDAGLGYIRSGRVVDFFINRIMFPLTDHRGNILGFSGRVFEKNTEVAKYVNTRETLVYHKGSVFFGLDGAKEEIKKEGKAIIVEGEFDVISCFQNSIKNVVAVKGTALTENQVDLLARFTSHVVLCFDQDKAGQEATKRSVAVLEKKGITVSIVSIPNAKDADESLKNDPVIFKKALTHSVGVYDFFLEQSLSSNDRNTAEGKRQIVEDTLPLFALIENEIIKEHYVRKLSQELNTSQESVSRQMEKIVKSEKKSEVVDNLKNKRTREEVLEEYLLALIVQKELPEDLYPPVFDSLKDVIFVIPAIQKIIEYMQDFFAKAKKLDQKIIAHNIPQELLGVYNVCFLLSLPQFEKLADYETDIKKTIQELKTLHIKTAIKRLSERIKEKELKGELEEINALQQQLVLLTQNLSQVQK